MHRSKSGLYFVGFVATSLLAAAQTPVYLNALPETNTAANAVSDLATLVNQSVEPTSLKSRILLGALDAGFLMGTSTAVHELGHARKVHSIGGQSRWETGDVKWWSYLTHRVPLAAGETAWYLPRIATNDERLLIATSGFNATTAWDESIGGHGPFGLITARYSTLLYEFSGVNKAADDLAEIERLYALKGYRISRHEMQGWQLLAGFLSQMNSSVRAYTYFTPSGVSVKTVARWHDWSVATEAVVHGASGVEMELGRRIAVRKSFEFTPKVLISAHGLGGALNASVHLRHTTLALNCQWVNPSTLLGARTETNFDLMVAMRL